MQRSGQGDAWLGGYDIFLCCQEKTLDINLPEPVCGEGWEKITCDRSVMQRSGQGDAWLGGYDIFLCCQEKTLDINLPGIQEISLLPAFEK